ncbi:UNVERIFIED_CONTAM: 60S ribosomal protein L2, mitochondrial [Sesamum calycinum]|uniref:60S ribosomal protein L2, mitochondrial n=1 Tax=Sesamum calycinum TaxID=2727403 RepID=A0AAW2JHA1_9LAMI
MERGGPPEKMQHDRRVRSAEKETRIYHDTIRGPFAFSSLPGKVDQRKVASFSPGLMAFYVVVGLPTRMPSWSKSHFTSKGAGSKKTCAKDVFFSAFSSPKAKGETASLSFGSSFGFPRIAVAGAKPAFFVFRMREKVRGKNTFLSLRDPKVENA